MNASTQFTITRDVQYCDHPDLLDLAYDLYRPEPPKLAGLHYTEFKGFKP